ncbi:MAG: rod shape-determining protein RodA [Chlorobiales bacterium]|nr:rod shape-determining protein RodA [Chlorobiales bacterium]
MRDLKFFQQVDFALLGAMFVLVGFGLTAIYSASHGINNMEMFYRQSMWFAMSLPFLILIFFQPSRFLQDYAYWLYGGSIIILIAVLFVGKRVAGSLSWVDLGFARFQPSEIAKITTIIGLARFLSDRETNIKTLRHFVTALGFVFFPVVLIMLQPDTGTALTYLAMIVPMIVLAGFDFYYVLLLAIPIIFALVGFINLFALAALGIVFLALLIFIRQNSILLSVGSLTIGVLFGYFSSYYAKSILKPHQLKRIETFLDPMSDPKGAGYNALQAKVAIGSGGLWGKGFLQGTQTQLRFIPAQWTDFIFCVIGEELGFIGAAILIIAFMVLVLRMISIIYVLKNKFAALVVAGMVSVFMGHILINIGMTLGLVPVIGVPLPFLSYGGSSLVANVIAVGIALNFYRNRRDLPFSL